MDQEGGSVGFAINVTRIIKWNYGNLGTTGQEPEPVHPPGKVPPEWVSNFPRGPHYPINHKCDLGPSKWNCS